MTSEKHGNNTLAVELASASPDGLRLLIEGQEYFASFEHFPWFRQATVEELTDVQMPHPGHLHWPRLDIDIAVASLRNPEKYPLVSRGPLKRAKPRAA